MIQARFQNYWAQKAASHPGGTELTERMLLKAGQCGWLRKSDYLLDIGCSGSSTGNLLRQKGYLTADIHPDTGAMDLSREDAKAFPWPEHFFDGVVAECTLSVMEPEKVLPEIIRVLKPEGVLLLSDFFEAGRRPAWASKYHFQVLYLENATPLLRSYMGSWALEQFGPTPVSFERLNLYWAILRRPIETSSHG